MDKGYLIAVGNLYCYIQAAESGWFPDIANNQANRKEIPLTAETCGHSAPLRIAKATMVWASWKLTKGACPKLGGHRNNRAESGNPFLLTAFLFCRTQEIYL